MTGHRITWFNERPVEGTVHVKPSVFPCDRCGWFRTDCTCLGWRARVEAEHQAAVRRAVEPVAPVDPTGREWAAA